MRFKQMRVLYNVLLYCFVRKYLYTELSEVASIDRTTYFPEISLL
jgi:hypothetical protein